MRVNPEHLRCRHRMNSWITHNKCSVCRHKHRANSNGSEVWASPAEKSVSELFTAANTAHAQAKGDCFCDVIATSLCKSKLNINCSNYIQTCYPPPSKFAKVYTNPKSDAHRQTDTPDK